MKTFYVSDASQLEAALSTAKGRDIIHLAGGNYGDVAIVGRSFTSDVTITSTDPAHAATFNSLTVKGSANLLFSGIDIDFHPTAETLSHSTAVMIDSSKGIAFTNGTVHGEPAINGVAVTSDVRDKTDNVIGLPTARGFTIQYSTDVRVEHIDLSAFDRGMVLLASDGVTIAHNEIHDLRRSGIVGAADNLTIEDNHLSASHPWRWGQTPLGDHADFIALFNDDEAISNVIIRNNIMEQGDGVPILGMWVAGSEAAPFRNVVVEGNAVLGTDHQGIMLTWVIDGVLADNILVKSVGATEAPGILVREGTTGVAAHGNYSAFLQDKSGGANTVDDNVLVQDMDTTKPGFTDDALLARVAGLTTAAAVHAAVVANVPTDGSTHFVTGPPTSDLTATDAVLGRSLVGSSSADGIAGGAGNDTLEGRGGADTLVGGAGDDVYVVPDAAATLVEKTGEGVDTVVATGDYALGANLENLTVSPAAGNGWAGTGNALNNVITGNAGGDRLSGLDGADTINGGAGDDLADGGLGDDWITAGDGDDTVADSGGANVLRGDAGHDSLSGGAGFDDINGNTGNDTAAGGAGDDWIVGGKDNDLLFGDGGADLVYGNLGDDTCAGGEGNDTLRGGQGFDTLAGGGGDDFISGDRGDDTLTGGAGADTFHASRDAGLDRVLDFNAAQGDRVQLDVGTAYTLAQQGADTILNMSSGSVLLVGVSMSTLSASSIFMG